MSEERLIICRNCGQSLLDDGDESMVWRHADGSRWCRDGRPAEPYGYWPDYRKADSKSGEPPLLCADCNHERDDSRFHFEAPGNNWGAALHHFQAPSGEPRTEPPHDPYAAYCTCSSCLDSSPDVNDPAPTTCGHGRAKGCCDVDDCVHSPLSLAEQVVLAEITLKLTGCFYCDGPKRELWRAALAAWDAALKGTR